ncbi:hypothetical protein GGF46_001729 [Coemansia sp. RSA 552]|nr:hypothetical protein GGF46_001729 [Coemansia sp. RSA 552]
MKFFATLALFASVAVAQQIGSDGGPNVSNGESAVSHPNINNGQQFQNSLVDASDKGGNVFHGLDGNTFNDVTSNTGISDNNMVNPSSSSTSGNQGPTTNGEGNQIGDVLASVPGIGGLGFGGPGFFKRDAIFNNGIPHSPVWGHPVPVPVFAPVVGAPIYPHPGFAPVGAHVNHNSQNAAIVQNQA